MKLAVLRHEEGIRLDPERLVTLYGELGETGAGRVIGRAIEDIAARLTEVHRHADDGDSRKVLRGAASLADCARDVGMTTLARVADDLIWATEASDWTAQAAILARVERIADRSRHAIWDLRRMTS